MFFITSAGFFWILDRRRWQDYRQASKAIRFKFLRNANLPKLQELSKAFQFFSCHDLVGFSALSHGRWQNRACMAFNFFYQGNQSGGVFRQGFACTLVECTVNLPEVRLWSETFPSPFGEDSSSLDGFFPDSTFTSRFHIRGRQGVAVRHFLEGAAGDWLLENQVAALETQDRYLLLARKAEWQPLELQRDLDRAMVFVRQVEQRFDVGAVRPC